MRLFLPAFLNKDRCTDLFLPIAEFLKASIFARNWARSNAALEADV